MQKVLILGSGALKIGQAGEFDYSGSQAIKALKEEGIKTVLVNPNIATVQTSSDMADEVYFVPIGVTFVEKIIKKEKPQGILLSFGGQTALNCGVHLFNKGILSKYKVKVLGSPISSIITTEDRSAFAKHMKTINQPIPKSLTAHRVSEALQAGETIGYPLMVRAGYALGGQGSGIVRNRSELRQRVEKALSIASHVLIEQYLYHYKEIEYEVVRDCDGNCVTVCNMENMDPLGIHTGESIVVAPSQTLTNFEYHALRKHAIDIVNSLGIVGECNIQYAINPRPLSSSGLTRGSIKYSTLDYYIIEINARLSRSSALASKATGYPLAYVAAKLALGKKLWQIPNQVTKVTQSFFEPALDYMVVKIPRWDTHKFKGANQELGSSMKSVGEVMGIGRTFPESLQKAVRMLEIGADGICSFSKLLNGNGKTLYPSSVFANHVKKPTPFRIFALAYLLFKGEGIETLAKATGIDPWFLRQIQEIVLMKKNYLTSKRLPSQTRFHFPLSSHKLKLLKQYGFSDNEIAKNWNTDESTIRHLRKKEHITPFFFQIDTLSAEFPAQTNYLYSTYFGTHHDIAPFGKKGVIVLGSGPYRIGSSVEFDWSAVGVAKRLSFHKFKSIMINSNPETVSTDYDLSDRLYFEELTMERILDIYEFEKSKGVVVSVGGQTPNNLALSLKRGGVSILGTDPTKIQKSENRNSFSKALDLIGIQQPLWSEFTTVREALRFAKRVGFPVVLRPSFVLSGNAMRVCYTNEEVHRYLKETGIDASHTVTVSKFIEGAKEIELDGVAQGGEIKLFAVCEHIENAGVHSGDATMVYPPRHVYIGTYNKIIDCAKQLAQVFSITGPFNIQFIADHERVLVIEMNLRASRSFPFISKAANVDFATVTTDVLFKLVKQHTLSFPSYSVVKSAQFSFSRMSGADPMLDVEMTSTGEAACFGQTIDEAFLQSWIAVGGILPKKSLLVTIGDAYKESFRYELQQLNTLGFTLYATRGTSTFLKSKLGISSILLNKQSESDANTVVSAIRKKLVECVINIPDKQFGNVIREGLAMRTAALDFGIPLITDPANAKLFINALAFYKDHDFIIKSVREYYSI